jgi:hypothetical protein
MSDETGLRIAYVCSSEDQSARLPAMMSLIRPYAMAAALARRGHRVDVVVNRSPDVRVLGPNAREVPFRRARWEDYDVVKTTYHRGFRALLEAGGGDHPWILGRLGEVVGREDSPGVHFFGERREWRHAVQVEIARRARVVALDTPAQERLWRREHPVSPPRLRVPTGVDAELPPLGPDPYLARGIRGPVAVFAGNLRNPGHQPEVNALWQDRLNRLGHALRRRGVTLVVLGPGLAGRLDPRAVHHAGPVPHPAAWDWLRHARVGIVLAQGPVDDSDKSKLYHYLRAGIPAACEAPVPNRWLIDVTGHGAATPYDDAETLAAAAAELARRPGPAVDVMAYMAAHHSWDARAARYDRWLAAVAAGAAAP